MAGLPIAVEVTPADAPREHVAVMLAACSRAAADVECVPAAEVPAGASGAVALVTWHGERRVAIEVGLREDGRPAWRSRTIDFATQDDPLERWRTVGFVVGTLSRPEGSVPETSEATPPGAAPSAEESAASRREPSKTQSSPAAQRPRQPVAPRRRANAEASATAGLDEGRVFVPSLPYEPARAHLDLGGAVGPALDGVRTGGLARGHLRLSDVFGVVIGARYLDRPVGSGTVGGRWITAGGGFGAGLATGAFELIASVEARAEYFVARAERDGRAASQGRWLPGAALGVSGGWMATPAVGIFAGGDAAAMLGTTDIVVGSTRVTTDSALRFAVEGGLRFRLW